MWNLSGQGLFAKALASSNPEPHLQHGGWWTCPSRRSAPSPTAAPAQKEESEESGMRWAWSVLTKPLSYTFNKKLNSQYIYIYMSIYVYICREMEWKRIN